MNEKWSLENLQKYCDENNIFCKILEKYYIDKGYQNVLRVKMLMPNGEIKDVKWNDFIRKQEKNNFTESWTQEKAFQFCIDNGYRPLDKAIFDNVDKAFPCKDNNGFIYMISISNLKRQLKNNGYFSKTRNNPYAFENVQLFCKLYKPEYELLDKEIKTVKDKYKFYYSGPLCSNTPRIFECTLDYFINGNGGIIGQNISKEANFVAGLLRKNKINFSIEKTFDDLKSNKGRSLRFDFAIYDKNNELQYLLEYDSKLHFQEISYFHTKNEFLSAQERDRKKNAYALAHNIPLIRIPYWDLETLSLDKLLNNISYKVTTIYHNDRLIIPSC